MYIAKIASAAIIKKSVRERANLFLLSFFRRREFFAVGNGLLLTLAHCVVKQLFGCQAAFIKILVDSGLKPGITGVRIMIFAPAAISLSRFSRIVLLSAPVPFS